MTVNGSKGFKNRQLPENPNPFNELTGAIIKFGEVYEWVETSKLQNFIDLEKQRMEYMTEMEIQRVQLFVQTQLELAKMKHGKQGNNTASIQKYGYGHCARPPCCLQRPPDI